MIPALVGRISFTGDLGYELWVEPAYQAQLFDLLVEAGRQHGIRLFGGHALNSLRLEKSFGSWATEYRPSYDPDEAGLGLFVKPEKGDFVGRDAVLRLREAGPVRRLVTFTVDVEDGPRRGRRDRRRAGLARRSRRRPGHLGRLRPRLAGIGGTRLRPGRPRRRN